MSPEFLIAIDYEKEECSSYRSVPPSWRVYNSRSSVLATQIVVSVRAGQQNKLVEKLVEIQKANRHVFAGTIARYVVKGNPELSTVHFFFVWKDTEMPKEADRQKSLKSFEEELADLPEWESAQYSTNTEPLLLLETVVGPVYVRLLLTDESLDDVLPEQIVDLVLNGARRYEQKMS